MTISSLPHVVGLSNIPDLVKKTNTICSVNLSKVNNDTNVSVNGWYLKSTIITKLNCLQ